MDVELVFAGAATGFLVGMTGVGGGALMTPLLLLLFGVAPASAIGTDLLFAAGTKVLAARIHFGRGLIDWIVVRRLWMGSLPAMATTLACLQWLAPDSHSSAFLKGAVGAAVLVTALSMLFQKKLHEIGRRFRIAEVQQFKALQAPLTILAGAILGVLVTLTSVGAGALGAVFLTYLYPLRLTPPRLIATDIVHAIPLALFAGAGQALLGNVDSHLLVNLLLGSLPAVALGAFASARLNHVVLKGALAAVLFSIGAKFLLSVAA